MKTIYSKFELFNAFMTGAPFKSISAQVINKIEREDGSNNSYNVTFVSLRGDVVTACIAAK